MGAFLAADLERQMLESSPVAEAAAWRRIEAAGLLPILERYRGQFRKTLERMVLASALGVPDALAWRRMARALLARHANPRVPMLGALGPAVRPIPLV